MDWQLILADFRRLDWSEVLEVAATVVVTWIWCKHVYARAWTRWAPVKAQDLVIEARRRVAEVEREKAALVEEVAELRGMIEGARLRLEWPAHLRLVEKQGGR